MSSHSSSSTLYAIIANKPSHQFDSQRLKKNNPDSIASSTNIIIDNCHTNMSNETLENNSKILGSNSSLWVNPLAKNERNDRTTYNTKLSTKSCTALDEPRTNTSTNQQEKNEAEHHISSSLFNFPLNHGGGSETFLENVNSASSLLTKTLSKTNEQVTIFDLRFEDRQRIASLISELAKAQEQVEMLKFQMERSEEHSQKQIFDLKRKVELLNDRCKYLVAQNVTQLNLNEPTLNIGKMEEFESRMTKLQQQNDQLKLQMSTLEETNDRLRTNLSSAEEKYIRCSEKNQRLRWILRTIQQREEILLSHNKCFNTEQEERQQQDFVTRAKSPSHIEILKANRNDSSTSSKPEASDSIQNIICRADPSISMRLDDVNQSQNFKFPNQEQSNRKSGGDFRKNDEMNRSNFRPFYKATVANNSPVEVQIPKCAIINPTFPFSDRDQVHNSQPCNYSRTKQEPKQKFNKSHHHTEVPTVNEFDNKEESILRDLFFTF